jgi:cytochrome P450
MPTAIEKLLRYGGLVHTLCRRAGGDRVCNGIAIATDSRVTRRPALGNRDPQTFSLGAGPHACAGPALVRMAIGVAIEALAEQSTRWQLAGEIQWKSGCMLFSPVALPVIRAGR